MFSIFKLPVAIEFPGDAEDFQEDCSRQAPRRVSDFPVQATRRLGADVEEAPANLARNEGGLQFSVSEINEYYTKTKPRLAAFNPAAVSEAAARTEPSRFARFLMWGYALAVRIRRLLPWLFLPMLFAAGLLEIALLRLVLAVRPPERTGLHERSRPIVRELVDQYPFGAYAVVWKSLQLGYLRESLPWSEMHRVVEAAIGEGTFSARVFQERLKVDGMDINPISLKKAAVLPHVQRALVCDCTEPPLHPGSVDLLISNNFLHHVTDKGRVLRNWSKVARYCAFNDCTPDWSRALPPSWILRKVGLIGLSNRIAAVVDTLGAQSLQPREVLEATVNEHFEVVSSASFFSARTYCIANVYSLLCLHMGPIPEEIKQCLLHPWLRRMSTGLTQELCDLLIQFDSRERRDEDVALCYIGRSRSVAASPRQQGLRCECGGEVNEGGECNACALRYSCVDGMWFILPAHLKYVEANYDPRAAAEFPREHL